MNAQSCLAGDAITPADMELLLDALAEGVLLIAPDSSIVFINKAACDILGVDRAKALQLGWEKLRKQRLALDISALPARVEELCQLDRLEVGRQADQSGSEGFIWRVRPLSSADGQPRLVALLFGAANRLRESDSVQQRTGASGQPACAAPPAEQPSGSGISAVHEASDQQQRELLCRTLEATGWNVAKAARRLKLSRTTLYARIARYGLVRPKD